MIINRWYSENSATGLAAEAARIFLSLDHSHGDQELVKVTYFMSVSQSFSVCRPFVAVRAAIFFNSLSIKWILAKAIRAGANFYEM